MASQDLIKEVRELRTQLAYTKNIGLFFGAGTSCAMKVPNIVALTSQIESGLDATQKAVLVKVQKDLSVGGSQPTIESILNRVRQIRAITEEDSKKSYLGISGTEAKTFDDLVCKTIYKIISASEDVADRAQMRKVLAWLSMQNQDFAKEIFTPNYDLLVERSLEDNEIPYFDGFVGAYEPFFSQETIDAEVTSRDLTRNWIRVWKMHGSLSWFWKNDASNRPLRVVRSGKVSDIDEVKDELVIYPSREKYNASRKQPFIAYFDRFRSFLNGGELLFIVSGYSFSDDHINDVIFRALRQNLRLSMIVFMYSDVEIESLVKLSAPYLNLVAFGPNKGILAGAIVEWAFDSTLLKPQEDSQTYWDKATNECKLGDFNSLVDFLVDSSGRQEKIIGASSGK